MRSADFGIKGTRAPDIKEPRKQITSNRALCPIQRVGAFFARRHTNENTESPISSKDDINIHAVKETLSMMIKTDNKRQIHQSNLDVLTTEDVYA